MKNSLNQNNQTQYFFDKNAKKRIEEGQKLGVKVGIWVHVPGPKYLCHNHIKHDGKPFLIKEGIFDQDEGRNILPGEIEGCTCTFRDFVPEFGDETTPEIEELLKRASNNA